MLRVSESAEVGGEFTMTVKDLLREVDDSSTQWETGDKTYRIVVLDQAEIDAMEAVAAAEEEDEEDEGLMAGDAELVVDGGEEEEQADEGAPAVADDEEEPEVVVALSDVDLQCMHSHYRSCYYFGEHPLIMERVYFDFRHQYIEMIENETLTVATADAEREAADPDYTAGVVTYNVNGSLALKTDPRENPKFRSNKKMCVRLWKDYDNIKSDRLPTDMSDLIYCDADEQCCGVKDGVPGQCCNVY